MKNTMIYLAGALAFLLTACGGATKLDSSMVPEPASAPQINLSNYTKHVLDNGLTLIVVENHKLPRVSYRLSVDRDPVMEGSKAGYVSMAGDLMRAGTKTRSKAQIDEAVDFIGARMNTSSTGVSGSCLKKHSDELLTLMSDVVLSPTFPEEELEKLRKQVLSGLASAESDPGEMSSNISQVLRYGKEHPYGEVQTRKSVESITQSDLIDYYNTYFLPNQSYLVVVGDITGEEALAQANKYFGAWEKKTIRRNDYAMPKQPSGNRVAFVPLNGAVQSQIDITYAVDFKPGAEDAVAASVMNSILGGGVFSGRLMQNLREDKGYTYGARSSLVQDPVVGYFTAGASVRNEVTDSSIVEFLFELKRMTEELVPDSTLQFVKNSMNGSFARSLESPQTIARFALNIERYQLPADYYATYLERLEAVTAEDVLAAAKKYIKPGNAFITVVGNKDEVADKLARFSSKGEVEFFDAYGNEWVDYRAAPEGITADVVWEAYFNALGGKEKMAKVKSYKQSGKMAMQGMELDMNSYMKDNSKVKMEVLMGGAPVMSQVFDGKKGVISQMGMKQEMSPEDQARMQEEADFMGETRLAERRVKSELLGVADLDSGDAFVIKLSRPSGSTELHYFDVKTGLKVQTEIPNPTPDGGEIMAVSKIMDYKEFEGVKFPVKIQQIAGPQQLTITISKVELNTKLPDSTFATE